MARKSEHTRDELEELILATAWEIIGEGGIEGLTARKVAMRIGYAPGTIYNLFQSMDDLVIQINGRTLDMLYDELSHEQCNDPKVDAEQNIKNMAKIYIDFSRSHQPYWRLIFTSNIEPDLKSLPWYQEKVERLFNPLESLLYAYFDESQTDERKRSARILWSSIHGLYTLHQSNKTSFVTEGNSEYEMSDYMIDTFIKGLMVLSHCKTS